MNLYAKLSLAAILTLPIGVAAFAQQPSSVMKQGDYYPPSNTTGVKPTAQDTKQAQQGDYYPPGYAFKVSDARYGAIEHCSLQALNKYPDTGGVDKAKPRHYVYEDCMASVGFEP